MALTSLLQVGVLINPQRRRAALQELLEAVVEAVVLFIVSWSATLSMLQDALLSSERFRSLLLRAFRRRHAAAVDAALVAPAADPQHGSGFDSLGGYWVDPKARQLLQFAGLHALSVQLTAAQALAPAQLLPCVSRVLLTTEERKSERYLEAVASALAGSMQAALLPVDAALLGQLGSLEEQGDDIFSAAGGAQLRLAWEALQRAVYARESPTVLYLRAADRLLCSSMEAYGAFRDVWGSPELLALEGGSRAPLVMVAGCTLAETGAGVTEGRGTATKPENGAGSGAEEEEGEDAVMPKSRGSSSFFKGLFGGGDEFGLFGEDDSGLGALLKELEGAGVDDRPNPRRVLPRLFPTRVKLAAPPSGPAALKHQQRMARDALESAQEENYRAARGAAAAAGVRLPPKACSAFSCSAPLSKADWSKALAWAVTMQVLQQAQRGQQAQQVQQHQEEDAQQQQQQQQQQGVRQPVEATAETAAGPGTQPTQPEPMLHKAAAAAGPEAFPSTPPLLGSQEGLNDGADRADASGSVRSSSSSSSSSSPSSCWAGPSGPTGDGGWVLGAWRQALALAPLPHLALLASKLQGYATFQPLQQLAGLLVGLLGWLAQQQQQQQQQRRRRDLQGAPAPPAGGGSTVGGGDGAVQLASGGSGGLLVLEGAEELSGELAGGDLELSAQAVSYGLSMLRRSGGAIKQGVRASNSYEKKLLAEVLSPEDCGGGFAEVGALEEAKQALREAVQLPLQHPNLFGGGALAWPSKGVLLFGPPGTGKTLLARAAAAECGASFLGINPSSVASKWFGDGVRFIRAAFSLAEKLSPCVIFVDEVDALLGRRNSLKEHEALREMKNELMAQWDGIRPGLGSRVMVLGATNRPFDIDEAVLRRFTHRVFVGLPNKPARRDILQVVLTGEALAPGVDLGRMAELTEGYSGSDLRQLCIQAAMRPVRELLEAEGSAASSGTGAAGAQRAQRTEQRAPSAQPAGGGEASPGGSGGGDGGGAAQPGAAVEEEAAAVETAGSAAGTPTGPAQQQQEQEQEEEGGGGMAAAAAVVERAPPGEGQERAADAGSPSSPGSQLVLFGRRQQQQQQQVGALLAAAEGMAGEAAGARNELRPISMQDLEEALKEAVPTVDPDSSVIQELNEWNARYGTVGSRRGVDNKRLSYFL